MSLIRELTHGSTSIVLYYRVNANLLQSFYVGRTSLLLLLSIMCGTLILSRIYEIERW